MWLARRLVDEVEERLWPLDALRRAVFRLAAPALAPYLSARGTRVAWLAAFVLVSSLALTLAAPLVLLAVGPLLLGVPHLVADVRYLVQRPGLHRAPGAWVTAAVLVAAAVERDLALALLAPVPAALWAPAPTWRRAAGAAPWLLAALASTLWSSWVGFGLAQAHNGVAVVVWLLLGATLHGPAGSRGKLAAGFVAAAAALGLGVFDPVLAVTTTLQLPGAETLASHARTVAPFDDPRWQLRGVAVFTFAQSVHYGLWLRVLPEEARPRPSTRTWRASFRALRADVGDPLLAAALAGTAALLVLGPADWAGTRDGYLALAFFHAPLELAVLTRWWVEGRVRAA